MAQLALSIGKETINQVNSIKTLGVHFSSDIKWYPHFNEFSSKILLAIYKLCHLKSMIHINVLRTVYLANIESGMRYGLLVWGSISAIDGILISQQSAIFPLAGVSQRTSCRSLFIKLFRVVSLYILAVSLYLHKNKETYLCTDSL